MTVLKKITLFFTLKKKYFSLLTLTNSNNNKFVINQLKNL